MKENFAIDEKMELRNGIRRKNLDCYLEKNRKRGCSKSKVEQMDTLNGNL